MRIRLEAAGFFLLVSRYISPFSWICWSKSLTVKIKKKTVGYRHTVQQNSPSCAGLSQNFFLAIPVISWAPCSSYYYYCYWLSNILNVTDPSGDVNCTPHQATDWKSKICPHSSLHLLYYVYYPQRSYGTPWLQVLSGPDASLFIYLRILVSVWERFLGVNPMTNWKNNIFVPNKTYDQSREADAVV